MFNNNKLNPQKALHLVLITKMLQKTQKLCFPFPDAIFVANTGRLSSLNLSHTSIPSL